MMSMNGQFGDLVSQWHRSSTDLDAPEDPQACDSRKKFWARLNEISNVITAKRTTCGQNLVLISKFQAFCHLFLSNPAKSLNWIRENLILQSTALVMGWCVHGTNHHDACESVRAAARRNEQSLLPVICMSARTTDHQLLQSRLAAYKNDEKKTILSFY